MKEKKLISVIVPIYNAENVIERCLNSLLLQTYNNLEIILVNDGSKDNSLSICEKYASLYSNIKVIDQENRGVGMARNNGISNSTGEYICFVDADDFVDSTYIDLLYRNLIQNDAELSICGYKEVTEDRVLSNTTGVSQRMDQRSAMYNLLLEDSFRGYVWNKLFRLDLIKKNNILFDTSIALWEDVLFVFQYLLSCQTVIYDPSPVYSYVYMENSASHMDNHIIGVVKSYDAIIAKDKIFRLIPMEYSDVGSLLSGRYIKSALSTLRNIGYLKEDNEIYTQKCIEIIKQNKKNGYKYLSIKEKVISNLYLLVPNFLFWLYKKKA